MPYDIYGCQLSPGHCEVHPDVPEEYPCSVCMEARGTQEPQREPEYPEPTVIDYIGVKAETVKEITDKLVTAVEKNDEGEFLVSVTALVKALNPEFIISTIREIDKEKQG